jgi:hypothetical protein
VSGAMIHEVYRDLFITGFAFFIDYIIYLNLLIIQGYDNSESFIITQDPLESTVADFWRMVSEQSISTLVMLSDVSTASYSLSGDVISSAGKKISLVRFQVLTAASMMFRVVFWDILPCKMIVDRHFRGAPLNIISVVRSTVWKSGFRNIRIRLFMVVLKNMSLSSVVQLNIQFLSIVHRNLCNKQCQLVIICC